MRNTTEAFLLVRAHHCLIRAHSVSLLGCSNARNGQRFWLPP
jgi:hypothetical protein